MANSITPPPELVEKWAYEWNTLGVRHPDATNTASYVAIRAAQWGAEERMHAICGWLDHPSQEAAHLIGPLLAHFCPTSPSLKEQAKQALGRFNANAHTAADQMQSDFDLLRRAIEALPDNTAPGD
jgi:hypothetical protein